jgi:hypothetical protein
MERRAASWSVRRWAGEVCGVSSMMVELVKQVHLQKLGGADGVLGSWLERGENMGIGSWVMGRGRRTACGDCEEEGEQGEDGCKGLHGCGFCPMANAIVCYTLGSLFGTTRAPQP